MNGKLIYKRKRDEQVSISEGIKRERLDPECYLQERPSVICGHHNTPPPSPPPHQVDHDQMPNTRNKILLEALQKIVELQKELDDFETDLDYSDEHGLPEDDEEEYEDSEVSFYLNEHQQNVERQCQRDEAEALGFAMCARETLLFLQQEGIPQDSQVYRALYEKLVGQVESGIPL